MKIGFAPNLGIEILRHSSIITSLNDEIQELVKDKQYGEDISELYIGVVSVSPQFAQFFKPQPPKYTKGNKSHVVDGVKYNTHNSFEYDITLDFEGLKSADEPLARRMIADSMLSSFDVFKKFKNFNSGQFRSDLEGLFKSKGWL